MNYERIENNFMLGEEIKDLIDDAEIEVEVSTSYSDSIIAQISKFLKKDAEFVVDKTEISIDNHEYLAQGIWRILSDVIEDVDRQIEDAGDLAMNIREAITTFVNENYDLKCTSKSKS